MLIRFLLTGFGSALVIGTRLALAAPAMEAPPFPEVLDLVRSKQHVYSPEQLNQMAVEGFVQRLGGLARFSDEAMTPPAGAQGVTVRIHEGAFGYLRIAGLGTTTRADLVRTLGEQTAGKTLKGWVIDLRFAAGRDFAAAAQVADLFLPAGKPVMDWGQGLFVSTDKTNAIHGPFAVLINHQTRGAAEAVAAVLRGSGVALAIGGSTAGEVARYEEFTLSNGRRLQLAVAPVRSSDGSPLAPTGLQPDIAVTVREELERTYLEDPFGLVAGTADAGSSSTNGVPRVRHRLTEAELVRARKGEKSGARATNGTISAVEPPATPRIVRDPVLARALDLLKGLNVIQAQ